MIVVWLRNIGTEEDQCWVLCARGDPGAVEFQGFPPDVSDMTKDRT
jgi:hypothetical protein